MKRARSSPGPSDDDIASYDYSLPPDRIASQPAPERSGSRLLVHDRASGSVRHCGFAQIGAQLAPGDLLVVNDVRVIPARLRAQRSTGGLVEVLLHPTGRVDRSVGQAPPSPVRPGSNPPERAFVGQAMLRPSSRIRRGETLALPNGRSITVEDQPGEDLRIVSSGSPLEELLEGGELPLPPYLDRSGPPTWQDAERYQTVFAAAEGGAIAAPTAGLHFTPELIDQLTEGGIETAAIRLFVGPGTFLPVRCERLSEHRMHEEAYLVPERTRQKIAACRRQGGRVVAVGTTTTRALESACDGDRLPRAGPGRTRLMIRPPFTFRGIDALLTNFHLPRSTLLALVSAFADRRRVLDLYEEAIREGYRFYSYGDAMLLL